jgi:hypothetical protein
MLSAVRIALASLSALLSEPAAAKGAAAQDSISAMAKVPIFISRSFRNFAG